jgi:hypothetical protein
VEAVHGIMEREFYELERFRGSLSAFLGQAYQELRLAGIGTLSG